MNKAPEKEVTEVRDLNAEKGIIWNNIATAVIIAIIIGGGTIITKMGDNFGDRVIGAIDKINENLVEFRKEMALSRTQGAIQDLRLDNHDKDISQNSQRIEQLTNRKY